MFNIYLFILLKIENKLRNRFQMAQTSDVWDSCDTQLRIYSIISKKKYSFLYFSFSSAYKSVNPKHEISSTAQGTAVMEVAVTPKQ